MRVIFFDPSKFRDFLPSPLSDLLYFDTLTQRLVRARVHERIPSDGFYRVTRAPLGKGHPHEIWVDPLDDTGALRAQFWSLPLWDHQPARFPGFERT